MPEDIPNMKDSWFFDKNFNGLSDEIFDELHFFDFPLEDVETNPVEEDWSARFQSIDEPCFDAFSVTPVGLCGKTKNENPQVGNGFSAAPCNEISSIKEVAKTVEPTYGKTIPNQDALYGKTIPNQDASFYEKKVLLQYSPVSVFEGSSGASSVENSTFDLPVFPVKRPRSKRRRPSKSNPVFSFSFIPNSPTLQKHYKTPVSKKQRKKDVYVPSGDADTGSQESVTFRKCTHCEITKTPQWREGPNGPKTLCNACGVRYRSGRLYPEYRPANSPTFVESVHSNCHKKVLEMRGGGVIKGGARSCSTSLPSTLPGNSVGQHYHGTY
ncbi:GATA transcription factor 11-like [Vicia villosa]|uniref:GATA transcription factor 11-like n=1 Tax=Vicia villosa TaxID=3911 RepID=UPI00273CE0A1|nr:GATA transcription factor 11-like [Vicia villosa]